MTMIDMHSHILYNVDDGPDSFEQSMELLAFAAEKEGITEIISTSHVCNPHFDVTAHIVLQQVEELQQELNERQISLKVHVGHEVRLCENLVELVKTQQVLTLAQSNYILLELPSSTIPHYTKNIVRDLIRLGYTPIIAHPERNKAIAEKPERLQRLILEGAYAQVTAGSIAGHFGKGVQKVAMELIKGNLVHTYGSDVHNIKSRPFLFEQGLSYLEKHKQNKAVDMFLENNTRIIENTPLILFEPVVKKKWWSFS